MITQIQKNTNRAFIAALLSIVIGFPIIMSYVSDGVKAPTTCGDNHAQINT